MARPLTKTFDPKCYELATAFVEEALAMHELPASKKESLSNNLAATIQCLAATIQEAIEVFLEYEVMKERGEVPDEE